MTIQTDYLRTEDGQLRDIKNLVDKADLGQAAYSDLAPGGSGSIMQEGSHGYGGMSIPSSVSDGTDSSLRTGNYGHGSNTPGMPHTGPGLLSVWRRQSAAILRMSSRQLGFGTSDVLYFQVATTDGFGPWGEVLMLGINAELDTNGQVIASSPVLRLYSDHIEDNGQVDKGVRMVKNGVGDYSLTGTLGVADDNKGTIVVPKDPNGNVDVHMHHEYVDGVLRIRTSEPAYENGRCVAGEPADIPKGRFLSIRLHEEPAEKSPEAVENDDADGEQESMGD